MSSFTDRIAVIQGAIDNLAAGDVDIANFPSHAHQSMVNEGYLRYFASRGASTEVRMTENGKKWAEKMKAAGYITGTVPAAGAVVACVRAHVASKQVDIPQDELQQG
jgi:TctA family transporter